MPSGCPDCGNELVDITGTLRQEFTDNGGEEVLKSVSEILGYYCSDCSDFYSADDLNNDKI